MKNKIKEFGDANFVRTFYKNDPNYKDIIERRKKLEKENKNKKKNRKITGLSDKDYYEVRRNIIK
jgi:hypothetical protein